MADLAFNFQDEWYPATNTPDLAAMTLNNTTDKSKLWVAVVAGTNSVTGSSLFARP